MFAYQNFNPQSAEMRPGTPAIATHFTPAEALEAARLHKNTLDHFHVELARSPSVLNDIQRYLSSRTKFGSFREFTALETMMVPHAYLPVHPELPRSLKEIEITDCNSSIQNMAQNIAKDARKGLYPELRDVRVLTMDVREPIKLPGGRIPPGKTPEACFLGLRELFKGTKVDFNISPYVLEPYGDDEDYDDEFQLPGLGAGGPPGGNGMPPALLQLLMQEAMRDPDLARGTPRAAQGPPGAARGPPRGARGPPSGPPGGPQGRNEMPPGLLDLLMEQAMRDPDFAHLRPPGR